MAACHHGLEPQALIDAFIRHPPDGFLAHAAADGTPWFTTRFDLLTTLNNDDRDRLSRLPGFRFWRRLLRWPACFIGTTVSEYSPQPVGIEPADYLRRVRRLPGSPALTIIKDLPCDSPLLPAADNLAARRLFALAPREGFISIAGQALAYVPVHFDSIDEYLARLSHSRRRNLRRKLRSRDALRLEILPTGDPRLASAAWRGTLYRYYLAVYDQSEIHFDRLSADFFDALLQDPDSGGRLFCYWHNDHLVGFNLCYVHGGNLVDKYIGFDYAQALRFNLYFVSWFANLEYAIEQGLRYYVAGWTDPQVKAQLGASFTMTRHLVWVRNPLLRALLRRLSHHFESDSDILLQQGEA
ncbi:GNAT family N-acetyltransferase [Pluralibacter gergoviae]|uniref:GNAT family N-acetyltransferase n=1 Tax=Pluralibacter gergoviae TaxID=61647 RepID=UPI0008DBEFFC|nr:GNAT family N-acetyltransferase [Pluralibacter gergoviae]EKW6621430.1 GNAT family N-acetyltransferase [Pluralibacter gergoviae]EKZ9513098.1 GNAT family N-acetyltransferase [Pluralibacter gergoviae]ELC3015194.1 GNAT family N-acetyltransferase [Pluralibacter gergoviae]ELC3020173.1 GNAT family N-acetyltransferase [Pluralibacter gergoviae]ELG9928069.1 GNAT family N-acetyltransferase [Pluralibacter gergoviae]